MYLSGLTFMVGAIWSRTWAEARIVPPITAVWTGGLLVVSLLHFDAFDLGQPQDAVWFAAYLIYPLIALGLVWRHRGADSHQRAPGRPLATGAVRYLTAQGVAATALGTALFLVPGAMADRWPWPITSLLAQLYAAPLLAYGVGSLLLSRQRTWPEVRVALAGMLVFAVGVLVASLLHRELFSADDLAAWLWFGAFAVATVALARLTVSAMTGSSAPATATEMSRPGTPIATWFRVWLGMEIFFALAAILSIARAPADTASNFAWPIQPVVMAAVFGAFYLAVAPTFVVAVRARRWEMVRVLVLPAAVFTTALLVATIVHWDKFSVGTAPFALWLASYLLPPPSTWPPMSGTSGGRGRPPPTTPCRPGSAGCCGSSAAC